MIGLAFYVSLRSCCEKSAGKTSSADSCPLEWTVEAYCFVRHFTEDCFEADSAIAASVGLRKRVRLKPGAIPTVFERQEAQPCSSEGSSSGLSRKRTIAPPATATKKPKGAYLKRERARVRVNFVYLHTLTGCMKCNT